MSGGSFNYLCYKDGSELLDLEDDIDSMYHALKATGYAEDAAQETLELLQTIRDVKSKLNKAALRLENVWHGMEWWGSNDYSEDNFKNSLIEYRTRIRLEE